MPSGTRPTGASGPATPRQPMTLIPDPAVSQSHSRPGQSQDRRSSQDRVAYKYGSRLRHVLQLCDRHNAAFTVMKYVVT